jgi:hypothetical protein
MRVIQTISRTLLLAGALAAGAQGQSPYDPIPPDQVALRYYTARVLDNQELIAVAEELFGARILLGSEDGDSFGAQHFLALSGSIIVRDTAQRADAILVKLAEIEDALFPPEPESESAHDGSSQLELLEYSPRHLSCRSAFNALSGFQRSISVPPPGNGRWTEVPTISFFEEGGLILVRETPEKLAEIRALLERIDAPVPQAMFTLMILRGLDQPSQAPDDLPPELTESLARLTPIKGFELLATSAVRGALRGGLVVNATASMDQGPDMGLVLEIRASAYDPARRELTIERCRFLEKTSEQSFETALALRAGEYTVIGAVGSDPLFVVLRMEL